jgi:phosphotransferase system enzyme I (PtsI)
VVDGRRGVVVVEPSRPALEGFRAAQEREIAERRQSQETRSLSSATRDGVEVRLEANVEFIEEATTARLYGAEGIGLFRTEYLLARSRGWPTEEQQIQTYRALLDEMRPHPVTVRTWDIGRQDLTPGGPVALNPALGERAFRLAGRDASPFRTQLRALLRAAVHGPLRIMFPFVGGVSDLRAALSLVEESRNSLRREGVAFAEDVPVGITLELPSAALTADLLAVEADFFSVGTNDLIQYLLAVDRSDPRLSPLYQPLHPAVLRAIRHVVEAANGAGVPLAVCGEMASDPLHALILLGLGVRDLSMSPASIPKVKAAVRRCEAGRAEEIALACLSLPTAEEIERLARESLGDLVSGDGDGDGLAPAAEGRALDDFKEKE